MKRLAVIFASLVFVIGAIGAFTADAQEAPLDLGEQGLLSAACANLWNIAINESLNPTACRRWKPDVIEGHRGTAYINLYLKEYGSKPLQIEVTMYKTLWTFQTLLLK